nr:MAG: hypothetical protein [Bacteriophage sp.]
MKSYGVITRSYKKEREVIREKEKELEREVIREKERKRESWNNRFRLIIRSVINRMKRRRKKSSRTNSFSMTSSTLNSTFTTPKIILISTFNLNLTLFEPHPTPPSHSPQTLQCPLSSPYPLSPHSIPLVTSNFISITFCYKSKSP